MQQTDATSQGTVTIGPGTMYGIFSTLEKQGLIKLTKEEERRKSYILTDKGKEVLREQIKRLLLYLVNFLLPLWISVFVTTRDPNPSPVRIGINLMMSILVLVYIYAVIGILWRIKQLKKS